VRADCFYSRCSSPPGRFRPRAQLPSELPIRESSLRPRYCGPPGFVPHINLWQARGFLRDLGPVVTRTFGHAPITGLTFLKDPGRAKFPAISTTAKEKSPARTCLPRPKLLSSKAPSGGAQAEFGRFSAQASRYVEGSPIGPLFSGHGTQEVTQSSRPPRRDQVSRRTGIAQGNCRRRTRAIVIWRPLQRSWIPGWNSSPLITPMQTS
jgi:hypothetical protein